MVLMDAVLVLRPWWSGDSKAKRICKLVTEGFHIDQNPSDKPYFDGARGIVPLFLLTTRQVGGLCGATEPVMPLYKMERRGRLVRGWRNKSDAAMCSTRACRCWRFDPFGIRAPCTEAGMALDGWNYGLGTVLLRCCDVTVRFGER